MKLKTSSKSLLSKAAISQKGFALVATIIVMSMLMLLSVSMLTMSSVSTRSTAVDSHQRIAEANARMALIIALSKLQDGAGQDQRVTATASILDSDPSTELIDNVANPHWVGVWRTDGLKDEAVNTGLIQQTTGSVTDRRSSGYDKKSQVIDWLVSGTQLDPTTPLSGSDVIKVFTAASTAPATDTVTVRKVRVADKGHYAFWVSDEGVKARINLQKGQTGDAITFQDPESYNRILSPNAFGLKAFYTTPSDASDSDFEKIIDLNQVPLANLGGSVDTTDLQKSIEHYYHDLTTDSISLLTDTRNGGLKRNLTAFLNSNGSIPDLDSLTGASDMSPIIENVKERDTITPKLGAIREWFKLRDLTTGTLGDRSIKMTYANTTADNAVDITQYTEQPIQPVLLDASYQLNYGYEEGSRKIYELIYPRAVIWNPYNVKLTIPKLYVHFSFKAGLGGYKVKFENPVADSETVIEYSLSHNQYYDYNPQHHKRFTIPAMTLEPGECAHFTTPSSGLSLENEAREYSTSIDQNLLSATTDPNDQYCYYRVANTIPETVKVKVIKELGGNTVVTEHDVSIKINELDLTYGGPFVWGKYGGGGYPCQAVHMYAAKNGSAPAYTDLGSANFPAIQRLNLDHHARVNNGRWIPNFDPPGFLEPLSDALPEGPNSLVGFGVRWRAFTENPSNKQLATESKVPWYCSPLAHYNVRSQNIHRWPSDNLFGMRYTPEQISGGARGHLYSWGPLSQTREFPQWTDISNSVELDSKTGRYRTGPFFDASTSSSSISTYPLFDIPSRELSIHSIGALQHVQFSPQVWHPTYIIGNGNASPYVDPSITSLDYGDEETLWNEKMTTLQLGLNNDIHRRHQANNNPFIYDISYETNLHLWDKYFLSSLSHETSASGWDDGTWDASTPLPNARMILSNNSPNSSSYTNLTNFHKAAQGLMISGGFNINSTSVKAWQSLLRSFNGIELQSRNGSAHSANPFSRFIVPENGAAIASDATDSDLWSAYRDLTDPEIETLAKEIVKQVKKRAPFISLSDFVNRRVGPLDGNDDELQLSGTLQAAINRAQLNSNLDLTTSDDTVMPSKTEATANYDYDLQGMWGYVRTLPQQYNIFEYQAGDSTSTTTHHVSKASGATGYLSQGDILQQIGSTITARSDTFKIRCYGDSLDSSGNVKATAWCEAVVQRIATPLDPDPNSKNLNPLQSAVSNHGRKFILTSFRWVSSIEIDQ